MAAKVPIRAVFDGTTATGLAEFQSTEFIALAYGGLGASLSIGTAGQILKVNSAADALEFGSVATLTEIDSGSTVTLDATTDIVLDAGGGDVFFKDDGTTFGSATNTSGNLIIKSGTTTAATFSGANVTFAGTVGSGAITSSSTIEGTTITATTAFVPDAADGATLGTSSLEFSDLYLADSSVIYFGADQDVTITHDPDDGLFLKSTATGDDNPFLLTLQTGETDIAVNDILGSIRFQAPDEGTGTDAILVAASIDAVSEGDFSSSSNATKLSFKVGVSEAASEKMSLSSAGLLTIADDLMIKDGGTIGVASTNDAITISSAGIVTFKDDILIKNGGTIGSAGDADSITIDSSGNVTASQNLTVTGNFTVNGTTTTVATTNMVVSDNLIELNNGAGSNANDSGIVIERGSTGDNAFIGWDESADKFIIGTTTSTAAATGNISITTGALVANIEGSGAGLTAGTTPLTTLDIDGGTDIGEAIVDADLFVIDNGAGGTNRKTTAARVKSYIGGGGLVPITHYSPSSATALDIEDFSATYEMYHIYFHNILFDSTADIEFRFKIGGSYIDSSDYVFQTQYNAMAGNDPTQTNQSGRDAMKFGIGGRDDITGCMTVYAVNGTTSNARASFVGFIGTLYAAESFWVLANTGAVQGVKVICGGGMTGKISIFGVVNA